MYRHGAYPCTNCCCLQVTKKIKIHVSTCICKCFGITHVLHNYTVMVNTFSVIKTYTLKAVKF